MARKASPGERGGWANLLPHRCRLKPENREIDQRVCEKEIEEITKPVGRTLGHGLPEVPATGRADAFLRHEHGRDKNDEDTDVQTKKEIVGRDLAAQERADVHPNAEDKSDEGQKCKQTEKWSELGMQGVHPIGGIGVRRPIAEKRFDGIFEQNGAGLFVRMVLHGDGLAFEASQEFQGCFLRTVRAFVLATKGVAG